MCLTTTAPVVELADGVEGGVDVDQVVEAELLAPRAQTLGPRERPGGRAAVDVEGARLMGVLAVP